MLQRFTNKVVTFQGTLVKPLLSSNWLPTQALCPYLVHPPLLFNTTEVCRVC